MISFISEDNLFLKPLINQTHLQTEEKEKTRGT
jgi:hypothetical protein